MFWLQTFFENTKRLASAIVGYKFLFGFKCLAYLCKHAFQILNGAFIPAEDVSFFMLTDSSFAAATNLYSFLKRTLTFTFAKL